jgi:hypothetical protein
MYHFVISDGQLSSKDGMEKCNLRGAFKILSSRSVWEEIKIQKRKDENDL